MSESNLSPIPNKKAIIYSVVIMILCGLISLLVYQPIGDYYISTLTVDKTTDAITTDKHFVFEGIVIETYPESNAFRLQDEYGTMFVNYKTINKVPIINDKVRVFGNYVVRTEAILPMYKEYYFYATRII